MSVSEQHAVREAVALVQKYGSERRDAVSQGLETPRLAGLLVQKYGVGLADLTSRLFGTFGANEVTAATDRAVEGIDPDWRENGRKRYAANPADLLI